MTSRQLFFSGIVGLQVMYFFYSPFFIPNSTFTSPLMLSIYKCYGCWMRIGEKIEYRKLTELFNKIDNLIGCIKRPPFFYLRVDFTGFIRVHRVWKWPPKVTENCENWKKNGILIAPWLKMLIKEEEEEKELRHLYAF